MHRGMITLGTPTASKNRSATPRSNGKRKSRQPPGNRSLIVAYPKTMMAKRSPTQATLAASVLRDKNLQSLILSGDSVEAVFDTTQNS